MLGRSRGAAETLRGEAEARGDACARNDSTAWEITAWVAKVRVERVAGSAPRESDSREQRCWATLRDAFGLGLSEVEE